MNDEAIKLRIIAKLKKINDNDVLHALENVIDKTNGATGERKRPIDFAGIWTEEEAEEIKSLIEESCEQINPDDWK